MKSKTVRGIACIVICLLMTVGGGIAGLGYLTYCAFFSGELTGEYDLSPELACSFELTPEMSPVAVGAGVTFVVPRGQYSRKHAVYDGILRCGDATIWSGQFGASIDDDDYPSPTPYHEELRSTKSYTLPSFNVPKRAIYTFTAEESLELDLEVVAMPLSVRRNATTTMANKNKSTWFSS